MGGSRWMLETLVRGLEYDFRSRRGTLFMDECCCCDMGECIDLFEKIDPEVRHIATLAGEEADTTYRRIDGEWRAFVAVKVA